MTRRDIVVIGGSAGGIEALLTLVAGLPADVPAAIFVVVHMSPYGESRLPALLRSAGRLPAAQAEDGESIEMGRIYVAPPDRHLVVRPGRVALVHGPRENHSRPAIDPLFRTAARAYGPRVIGVVLSGALYDGSMGLLAIKTLGGIAVVQDPAEATFDSMPRSALQRVTADHVAPVAAMPALLSALIGTSRPDDVQKGPGAMADDVERLEAVVAVDFGEQANDERADETTVFTCPDCGGVLWQGGEGPLLFFRCHVGHAYAPEVLLQQKSEELEAALWSSLRLLKEKVTLNQQLATRTRMRGNGKRPDLMAERMEEQVRRDEQYVLAIQELLQQLPSPLDGGGRDATPIRDEDDQRTA
jgi:two-component system chemotaxis response regulator CheB